MCIRKFLLIDLHSFIHSFFFLAHITVSYRWCDPPDKNFGHLWYNWLREQSKLPFVPVKVPCTSWTILCHKALSCHYAGKLAGTLMYPVLPCDATGHEQGWIWEVGRLWGGQGEDGRESWDPSSIPKQPGQSEAAHICATNLGDANLSSPIGSAMALLG